jgi:hypothetical protein
VNGGPCNDSELRCYTFSFPHAPGRYTSPRRITRIIESAGSSQWVTIQSYILVTGRRIGSWDCRSPDWRRHWTYDAERYCWKDYLSIVESLPAGVTVTDPESVGEAWGRVAPRRFAIVTASGA